MGKFAIVLIVFNKAKGCVHLEKVILSKHVYMYTLSTCDKINLNLYSLLTLFQIQCK